MIRALAIAATLLAAPAFAEECVYRDGDEGHEVHQTETGYDIVLEGEVVDRCVVTEKDGAPWADCAEGWDGWVVFAGADADDPTDGEIMVLSYGVYYRQCV